MAKKITPERETFLTEWVYRVWKTHWKDLAPVSNSRAKFKNYILRDHAKLNDEILNKIARAISVQKWKWIQEMKKTGKQPIGIPCLSTWYNDDRWEDVDDDDDEQAPDNHPLAQKRICECEGCEEETHGRMFAYCAEHLHLARAS
jgi:hypothetical protein